MSTIWLTPEEFYNQENEYRRGHVKKEILDSICKKYNITGIAYNFVSVDESHATPNVAEMLNRAVSGSDCYIDHLFSFKDADGKIYWVSCPYNRSRNKEEIKRVFAKAYIPCFVHDGFYADYTILINPYCVYDASCRYAVVRNGDGYMYLKCPSAMYEKMEVIAGFSNEDAAKAFKMGLEFATNYWFEKLNM
jgi:hypothetical protein